MIAMLMKCMVCEVPTIMTTRRGGMEAAFCPWHMPLQTENRRIVVSMTTSYF